MSKDIDADGPYNSKPPAPGGSVLHREIQELKDQLLETHTALASFSVDPPQTVWAQIQVDIASDKTIMVGSARKLAEGETIEDGHARLYRQCLKSVSKLVG